MGLSIEEQETHINFSREDERVMVYASDTTTMTKLNKLINVAGTEWKLESVSKLPNGKVVGMTYSCPKEFISFRTKRISRELTEEQKKIISERMQRGRIQ